MTVNEFENKAEELFLKGYNCCQAVVTAFSDVYQLPEDLLLKMSCMHGGGFARLRNICGAVSGMGIATGLVYASDSPDAKKELYKKGQILSKKFEDEFGSIICSELLSGKEASDRSPEPKERTAEYYKSRSCLDCVRTATRIFAEDLKENERI